MNRKWKIAGINFDHNHMNGLIHQCFEHSNVEVVGICHETREPMDKAIEAHSIPEELVFLDYRECLEKTKPDIVILCPSTATHAEWTEKVAPYECHVIVEKPFASSLDEADRMIAALAKTGKELVINWPLRWYKSHMTAKRLIDEGAIGDVLNVHYYNGNRVLELDPTASEEERIARKKGTWFYDKSKGGGCLLDYLGYGVTLATWFFGGKAPIEVSAMMNVPEPFEVDEHSITVARYDTGLSKYETQWGTVSNPWQNQPIPKCGFIIKGSTGAISSYDYEPYVSLMNIGDTAAAEIPVDTIEPPFDGPINYFIDSLEKGRKIDCPLSPETSRIGQQIVDTAIASAEEKRVLKLLK